MPGLPPTGGEIYVIEKDRPAGAPGLRLNLPGESFFSLTGGLAITGSSTAQSIYCAAVIPGAVIDQGVLAVEGGKFEYYFDPKAISSATPTYDIINRVSGKPEIKDVVHLTFFSKELAPGGTPYHSFVRVIIRGTQVLYAR